MYSLPYLQHLQNYRTQNYSTMRLMANEIHLTIEFAVLNLSKIYGKGYQQNTMQNPNMHVPRAEQPSHITRTPTNGNVLQQMTIMKENKAQEQN